MTDIPLEKQPFFKESLEGKLQYLVLPYERDIPRANDNTLRFLHEKLLADNGKALKTLKHLAVQGCELSDEGVALLADIITHAPNLQKINFFYNQFTPEQTTVITDSLKAHRSLTSLVFVHENMGGVPADTIRDVMAAASNLETLHIGNCRFGDAACQALAEKLPDSKINSLGIEKSVQSANGLGAIIAGAEKSPQLVALSIIDAFQAEEEKAPVLRRAATIPHLRRLALVDNGMNASETRQVADLMGKNPSLDTIFLHEKELPGEKMETAMKIALENTQSIVFASFKVNPQRLISNKAMEDLRPTIQAIPDFSCLYANDCRITMHNSFQSDDISRELNKAPHGRSALKRLKPEDLSFLAKHPKTVFHLRSTDCTGLLKAEVAYPDFVKELPGIPPNADGWMTPNATGFSPVDNPSLWDTAEKAKEILSGMPLTSDALIKTSPKGRSLADAALATLEGDEFVKLINSKGVQLGAKELLDDAGGLSPLSKKLSCKSSYMRAAFIEDNWLGKSPGELRQVLAAMPDYVQENTSVHGLEQKMRSSAPSRSNIGR